MENSRKLLVVLAVLLPVVGLGAEDLFAQGRRGGDRGGGRAGPGGDRGDFSRRGPGGDRGDFGRGGPGGRPDFGRGGPGGDRPDSGRRGPGGDRGDFGRGGPGGRPDFGRGGPGGGPGGGRFGGMGPGGGMGPSGGQDRMQRIDFFLTRADANGDGVIGPDELQGPMGGMLRGMADRAGLDPSKPIPVAKLRSALEERSQGQQDESGSGSPSEDEDEKKSKAQEAEEPLVPGFGIAQQLQPVPPFGVRLSSPSSVASGSLSSGGSASSGGGSRKDKDKWRQTAKAIVERNDEDQSGALEKDEWDGMRISPEPADRNNDGVVTVEELAARLADDRNDREGSSGSGRLASSSGSESAERKSYRVRSPTERLPEGLPDWFLRYDTSGDGQVSMDEYASSWTESKAREFVALDLNNDGLITPREGLKAIGEQLAAEPSSDELATEPQTGGGFWFP